MTTDPIEVRYRTALNLIRDLTDSDDCWFDHHGGCQAHGYLSLEQGEKCPQQEAKELLAAEGGGAVMKGHGNPSNPELVSTVGQLTDVSEVARRAADAYTGEELRAVHAEIGRLFGGPAELG